MSQGSPAWFSSAFAAIVGNELRRITRDRTGMFFIVALPFLIILVVGSATPTGSGIRLAVVDLDDSATSVALVGRLEDTPGVELATLRDRDELERGLRLNEYDAGLVVPADLGRRVAGDRPGEVSIVVTPTSSAALTVQSVVGGALGSEGNRLAAVRFVTDQLGVDRVSADAAVDRADGELARVQVDQRRVGDGSVTVTSAFDYVAPGQLTLFMFINSLAVGAALVEMRTLGVARRMLASPTSLSTQVGGVLVSRMVFVLAQAALIVSFGLLLFGVDWGDPAGAAAVIVAFGLVSVGAGILAGTLARSPDQTTAVGVPLAIGLAMLGGCAWPSFLMPEWMQTVAKVTPHAWAMEAWTAMIFEGATLVDVLPQIAVLVGFAAVLLTVSVRRLRSTLTG